MVRPCQPQGGSKEEASTDAGREDLPLGQTVPADTNTQARELGIPRDGGFSPCHLLSPALICTQR